MLAVLKRSRGFVLSLCAMVPFVAFGQGSPSVQLLAHVNSYPSAGYNDCWGYTAPNGREYALLGVQTGTSIVDITNAPAVAEVAFFPSSTSLWKDIKTYRHYAYVVNESGGGMQIIDLSYLPDSARLVGTYAGFSTSHNIYIDTANAILYAEGTSGSQSVRVISLANPLQPVQLSTFGIECHDILARNNIAYVSEGSSGSIGIYDVNNPSLPSLLGRFLIPNHGYVHNCWLSEDGNYLMTTEETNGKSVKYWDVHNLDSVRMTDEYFASPFLAHNAHIKGDFAYIAYYRDGLRIVDVSDPDSIFEVGHYDTWSGNGLGAWGAFPFFLSGKVVVSDVETGLYVVYFEIPDSLDPNPPENVRLYSDYSTPTSMSISWTDPSTLHGGAPLEPTDFTIEIKRDTLLVGSVAGGIEQFVDVGLIDGYVYTYTMYAKLIMNSETSRKVISSWTAGGSLVPSPPTSLRVGGTGAQIVLSWRNPSVNVDGTPMDDFAGVRLYQNSIAVATFTRSSVDTARADSVVYTPSVPGPYTWYLTALDNEVPQHESTPSGAVVSSLYVPVSDNFPLSGVPNTSLWVNSNASVNTRGLNPPSPPYALNLNGQPSGGDMVDLKPVNLSGLDGAGITFSYYYQPQGTGEVPEPEDSLLVYFRNSLNEWIEVRGYPGGPAQPFQPEVISVGTVPSGGGTYFFDRFQVKFKSRGTPGVIGAQDDWLIDNVRLDVPTAIGETRELPQEFFLSRNFPNPFNPSTAIYIALPRSGPVRLIVYNLLSQKICTLVDEVLEAGTHTLIWDGRNSDGTAVASGTYLYRFEADGVARAGKMLLMK